MALADMTIAGHLSKTAMCGDSMTVSISAWSVVADELLGREIFKKLELPIHSTYSGSPIGTAGGGQPQNSENSWIVVVVAKHSSSPRIAYGNSSSSSGTKLIKLCPSALTAFP